MLYLFLNQTLKMKETEIIEKNVDYDLYLLKIPFGTEIEILRAQRCFLWNIKINCVTSLMKPGGCLQ